MTLGKVIFSRAPCLGYHLVSLVHHESMGLLVNIVEIATV